MKVDFPTRQENKYRTKQIKKIKKKEEEERKTGETRRVSPLRVVI